MSANFSPNFTGYTQQGMFKWWCQHVLPLVYDDSLSYYEVLCKVTNYLNNAIADVATVETNLDLLHGAYDNLETYVNEFLDNLDVQPNVNAHIDYLLDSDAIGLGLRYNSAQERLDLVLTRGVVI